ncbi:hypothetical protein PT974_03686 [Cladobotryum mycophilum]|uniref:DUF7703 domain-containing protein n=1 Tax=Cladobotryum mycophilum TaxID=491253 RepID=A0ABR0SU66_9HYPO
MAVGMQIRSFGSAEGLPQASLTIIVVFLSLALYNVVELVCIIFTTFKRYAGVYFWSFSIATLGILLNCSGFFIKFWGPTSLGHLSLTISIIGWVFMVTGQSMVLWSRLHLVLQHEVRLRIVLYIIIIDAILMHGTIIPMAFIGFYESPQHWLPIVIAEKFELIVFFLQEVMLSSLYIISTISLFRLERSFRDTKPIRHLIQRVILVNFLVIFLDISIMTLEFANQYNYQTTYKPFAYSVKLKLEFTVLNSLVKLATGGWEMTSVDGVESVPTTTTSSTSKSPAGRPVAMTRALSYIPPSEYGNDSNGRHADQTLGENNIDRV